MSSLMIQGTSSGAGKTVLVAALCRILRDRGMSVAPFKAQNMSRYTYRWNGLEIAGAQAMQAVACGIPITPDMNPILLRPCGHYTSTVYLNGKRFKRMRAIQYYTEFARTRGLGIALESFGRLRDSHDVIMIEGAGSPAEINLTEYDIANMILAKGTSSPVLLVSDIERGGSFASLAGTLALLEPKHRRLVRGMIINKFRGDMRVLQPGLEMLARLCKKPVLGVVPMIRHALPEEDSLGTSTVPFQWNNAGVNLIRREIKKVARQVEKNLDIDMIMELVK